VKDAAAAGLLDRTLIRIRGFLVIGTSGERSQLPTWQLCKVLALIFKTGRQYCSTTNLPRFCSQKKKGSRIIVTAQEELTKEYVTIINAIIQT
jgi:hypothetical protein